MALLKPTDLFKANQHNHQLHPSVIFLLGEIHKDHGKFCHGCDLHNSCLRTWSYEWFQAWNKMSRPEASVDVYLEWGFTTQVTSHPGFIPANIPQQDVMQMLETVGRYYHQCFSSVNRQGCPADLSNINFHNIDTRYALQFSKIQPQRIQETLGKPYLFEGWLEMLNEWPTRPVGNFVQLALTKEYAFFRPILVEITEVYIDVLLLLIKRNLTNAEIGNRVSQLLFT